MAVGRRPPFLVTWTSLCDFSNRCSWFSQSGWLKQEREKMWASQKLLLLTISIVTGCHFFISAFLSWAYGPTLVHCWKQVSRVMSIRREDPWAPFGGWLPHMGLVYVKTADLPLYVKTADLHVIYEAWISHSLLSFCLISVQFREKGKSCNPSQQSIVESMSCCYVFKTKILREWIILHSLLLKIITYPISYSAHQIILFYSWLRRRNRGQKQTFGKPLISRDIIACSQHGQSHLILTTFYTLSHDLGRQVPEQRKSHTVENTI